MARWPSSRGRVREVVRRLLSVLVAKGEGNRLSSDPPARLSGLRRIAFLSLAPPGIADKLAQQDGLLSLLLSQGRGPSCGFQGGFGRVGSRIHVAQLLRERSELLGDCIIVRHGREE